MRTRTLILLLFVLSLVTWAGLVAFVNLRAPDTIGSEVVFLLLCGAAVMSLAVPISYLINARALPWSESQIMQRAIRQGLLMGTLTVVLLTIQMLRLLTPLVALLLILLTVVAEVLLSSRRA